MKPKSYKVMKMIKNYDKEQFRNVVSNFDWTNGPNMSLGDRIDYLINNLKNSMNNFVIQSKIKLNEKCAWYSDELNKLKCDKIDAYNRFKLSDDQMDWVIYKSIRNSYVTQLRDSENNYYSQKVIQNRGDPKKMWSVLIEILGEKNT